MRHVASLTFYSERFDRVNRSHANSDDGVGYNNNNNNKTKISAPDRRRSPDFRPPILFRKSLIAGTYFSQTIFDLGFRN